MRNLLLTLLASAIITSANAQDEKQPADKMFHAIGTSIYMDIYNGPISEKYITVTDPFGNTSSNYEYYRVTGFSYLTLIYNYRYNIRELSDEAAFGVSAFPSLGIFVGGSYPDESLIPVKYSGCFNFPVMAGMNFGAAATNKSAAAVGVFLGAGYELNMAPMLYARTLKNKDIQTKWFNPCVSLGFRYEGNNYFGSLQEINLKMGFGLSGIEIHEPNNLGGQPFIFTKPFTFRLSYSTYLNY